MASRCSFKQSFELKRLAAALSVTYSGRMTPRQLREFRQRLGITQVAFAEAIGVAPNTVARWERGELNMRASTAKLIEMLMRNADLTKPEIPPTVEPGEKGEE